MGDILLEWRLGYSKQKDLEPDEFVPAIVPGAVQIDWGAAKNMPDWNRDVNFKEYSWMEDCYWVYRADIPKTELKAGEQLIFRCGGIDYKYEVYLCGELIYSYEGMFRPFELDVGKAADNGGELSIVIFPIPKTAEGIPGTRQEASESCKPAVSYGWDWHPRLVPSGIWDETALYIVRKERIRHAEVFYKLSDDLKSASITVDAIINPGSRVNAGFGAGLGADLGADFCTDFGAGLSSSSGAGLGSGLGTDTGANFNVGSGAGAGAGSSMSCGAGPSVGGVTGGGAHAGVYSGADYIKGSGAPPALLRFRLYAPDGRLALESTELNKSINISEPELWWCNGYGSPSMYDWELLLEKDGSVVDKATGRIGFRKVSLEMNPGAWAEPEGFPKTRSHAPITLTLNNVPIFAKGSNWVNPEIFPGAMNADTYRPLLEYAKNANMNLLRVWGGGIVNKESFFDLCDTFGLMVWQEFPLACNRYPDKEQYLSTLESEAAAIIKRLRKHACHVIWCGGNELFNNWSLMTDQSQPLRLLNKLCYELDFGKPYLPTSPISGMAHGCYLFVYPDGREVYQAMAEAHNTAYTEFGIPAISNLTTCLAATASDNLFPLKKNEITVAHHAFDAWEREDTWCSINILRKYFGEPQSLEQMIELSQWMQCEGYKCIYEEARRQKPYCSMALNWCFNEPWPTIANNSLINYPSAPKPAFYAVAQSCRNQLISARIPKFSWSFGEIFTADLWLLNDGTLPIPTGVAEIYLEYSNARHFLLRWDYSEVPANQNAAGPTVRHKLQDNIDGAGLDRFAELKLIISADNLSSEYRLIIK